jgi:hypothetical protein
VQAHAVNGRDLYRAANFAYKTAKIFLQLIIRCEDVFCLAVKNLARGCQLNFSPAADTLKQAAFEFILKRPYLLAHSRLCNKITLGRKRKTLKIDEIAKYL